MLYYSDMTRPFSLAIAFVTLLASFGLVRPLETAMTGGAYELYADSFVVIDSEAVSGGEYTLTGSAGEGTAVVGSGGVYELRGGFQAQDVGILSLNLNPGTLSFASLSSASVSTGGVVLSVSTDSNTGYSLSLSEDGNLRSGGNAIDDVSDGTVTAGEEEYGVRTSGADAVGTGSDRAISGSLVVASGSGRATDAQTTVQFRVGISPTTPAGNYSQALTFTLSVNP